MADSYTASGSRASRALIQRLNLPPSNLKNLDNTFVLLFGRSAFSAPACCKYLDPTPDAIRVVEVVFAKEPFHRLFFARNYDPIDRREEHRRPEQHHDRTEEDGQPEQHSREPEIHRISRPSVRRLHDERG